VKQLDAAKQSERTRSGLLCMGLFSNFGSGRETFAVSRETSSQFLLSAFPPLS
jgi:hypothetical protein